MFYRLGTSTIGIALAALKHYTVVYPKAFSALNPIDL